MKQIADDPIVRSMEQTGYPPWVKPNYDEYEDEEDFGWEDVFYGNQTEYF